MQRGMWLGFGVALVGHLAPLLWLSAPAPETPAPPQAELVVHFEPEPELAPVPPVEVDESRAHHATTQRARANPTASFTDETQAVEGAANDGDPSSALALSPLGSPFGSKLRPAVGRSLTLDRRPTKQPNVPPRLNGRAHCAGYFPHMAHTAAGNARVRVRANHRGVVSHVDVLAEQPRREGFGAAALACARQLHFSAATLDGKPVAGEAVLQLRFRRHLAQR